MGYFYLSVGIKCISQCTRKKRGYLSTYDTVLPFAKQKRMLTELLRSRGLTKKHNTSCWHNDVKQLSAGRWGNSYANTQIHRLEYFPRGENPSRLVKEPQTKTTSASDDNLMLLCALISHKTKLCLIISPSQIPLNTEIMLFHWWKNSLGKAQKGVCALGNQSGLTHALKIKSSNRSHVLNYEKPKKANKHLIVQRLCVFLLTKKEKLRDLKILWCT